MSSSMRRREFISLIGSAAGWPLAARAQQTMPVIGYLNSGSPDLAAARLRAFRQGLEDAGYVEGRNVAFEFRWAEGQNDRLPDMAADLVRRQVSVIAATGGVPPALAAKAATTTIPVVFQVGADPVAIGLVASLSRPGGNVTGGTTLNVEIGPKRIELAHELIPTASRIALLVNPANPTNVETISRDSMAAARALGLDVRVLQAGSEREIDAVFERLGTLRAGALVVGTDTFFNNRSEQIARLALRHAVPAIYQFREFAAAGGLAGYGGSFVESFRQVGSYTGRILKGEKPADLPVQQSTRIELILNLKTAKALGLTVPISLLGRADEVIE